MKLIRLIVSAPLALAASSAFAGTTLGRPLGFVLGVPLGSVTLGNVTLGELLPVVGSGVLLVGAAGLALGIYIVRRKQKV